MGLSVHEINELRRVAQDRLHPDPRLLNSIRDKCVTAPVEGTPAAFARINTSLWSWHGSDDTAQQELHLAEIVVSLLSTCNAAGYDVGAAMQRALADNDYSIGAEVMTGDRERAAMSISQSIALCYENPQHKGPRVQLVHKVLAWGHAWGLDVPRSVAALV